ncbi:MAG TPA: MBOAT family O-acyltransferase [bacterium]|nr:MBOAT family O-acyltransferase [bacterium]
MIVTTFAITALIVSALTLRLLPVGRSRSIAMAAINLLLLVYLLRELAPLAAVLIVGAWLLLRGGPERLPRWRMLTVTALMLVLLLWPKLDDVVPADLHFPALIGISYLAFCVIGLAVDRYRGRVERVGFWDFWNWLSFFPSFTAGPIRRFTPFAAQMNGEAAAPDRLYGALRVMIGLVKRVVFAAMLAPTAALMRDPTAAPLELWIGMYAYAFKIYLDFSAYTDIAVGAANMLGLRIEENFNWPYLATNISVFWKRWHMSLTGWLRDYLFIPLGGSRVGRVRTALNTVIVMVVIGLWHGLQLNFLAWGLYHALGLLIYRAYTNLLRHGDRTVKPGFWRRLGAGLLTFHFVAFGWIFFNCGFWEAVAVIIRMFNGEVPL